MPGLTIYTSNRLEILAEKLARIVSDPLPSLFSPEIIIVQSRGMERWVSMELARHNGICANCSFFFPNSFLQEIVRKIIPDLPEESPFAPGIMTFMIMRILPACLERPGFESLKSYLYDDINNLKLFQLSDKIADTFDQYLVFRPEMIFAWEDGRENHWQAQLWREISPGHEKMHRAWLRKTLLEKIRKQPDQIEYLPVRLSIFGISYLPPFHLQVLAELSRLVQVNLFFMNPCCAYWADIASDLEIKRIKKKYTRIGNIQDELHLEMGNRLLASLGALGKDFFSLISGLDCEIIETFEDQEGHDLLSSVKSDILYLKNREMVSGFSWPGPDSSIQIHSCHSPMREIEVLHDNLLAMFEEDPDLLPKDIIVMTPDIELYAPFIRAVFDAQADDTMRIPFSIADRSLRRESSVINGFLSILDFKESRFGTARVMALLEMPGIKEQFGLTEPDLSRLEHWIRDTGIRWGINAKNRLKLGLPGFPENTWQAGIERLLLGYAMPGNDCRLFAGILPYDNIEGGEVKILGKFMEFLEGLFTCIDTLERPQTLTEWHQTLIAILARFFKGNGDTEGEMQILRRILDDLSKKELQAGFNNKINLEVIRSYLKKHLERENLGSGAGFISGGVTFCSMLPMRSIPFKALCLIGMNNDAFPRDSQHLDFDLIAKNPQPGDRSRRNDDKYLFLEAIISANKKLYISYVGQSIQDNAPIPPSVMVSELLDYIEKGFGISGEDLVTQHRLQAFSPEYFKENNRRLFSYSKENFIAGSSIYDRQDPVPFIAGELSPPPMKWRNLDLDVLCAFFSNPAKFLLEKRLGIYLQDNAPVLKEKENFILSALEDYQMGQDLVAAKFSGSELQDLLPAHKSMGKLPPASVGDFIYSQISLDADAFVNRIENHIKGKPLNAFDVDLEIAGFNITGRLANAYEHGLVLYRYATLKTKDLLKCWIYHLVLCSLTDKNCPDQSCLITKNSVREFSPVNNSADILQYLLTLYWKGLSKTVHFFPESSFEYAEKLLTMNTSRLVATDFARQKWIGSEFARGEGEDRYFKLCFGKSNPIDEEFQKIAEGVFKPLLEYGSEIVRSYEQRDMSKETMV
ncbi:MAG: exodeoxyribonuclease V subunit gamma [Deltaproteobacteria bacterium CG1_02_45_11]|nr:MAG: exodeoxyribonuclease V subunit gamma [Deltaproteobacteria bacterium CG1_02_45_11]